jgi:hypothetical protein
MLIAREGDPRTVRGWTGLVELDFRRDGDGLVSLYSVLCCRVTLMREMIGYFLRMRE